VRFMVDSALPATSPVQPNLTLWDDVLAWAGGKPFLWGRYLGTGGGAATPLTADEANWLFARGCGVIPIYNDSPVNAGIQGTYALGQQDAQRAMAQAQAVGVPEGVYLVADIEYGAAVTGDWIRGWADAMRAGPYAGAGILYCAPRSPAFAQAWQDAWGSGNPNVRRLLIWSATPEPGPSTAAGMPPWGPDVPPGGTVAIWQYAEGAYGGLVDLDEADDQALAGGLWVPSGPKAPDLAAALRALDQAQQALAAARAALGGA
jgi:hypothetical protein